MLLPKDVLVLLLAQKHQSVMLEVLAAAAPHEPAAAVAESAELASAAMASAVVPRPLATP